MSEGFAHQSFSVFETKAQPTLLYSTDCLLSVVLLSSCACAAGAAARIACASFEPRWPTKAADRRRC